MFVKVGYYNERTNSYSLDRAYTYTTEMPLKAGDVVVAPTKQNPENKAMVLDVDVPKPPFECKAITQYYTEG